MVANLGEDTVGPGTVVGANVKLTGTMSDVNDITVHGTVEGEVVSDKTVTITETAVVKGPVSAEMVSVSGKITGGVTARQKIELLPTAQVNGSISTKELIIKSGAVFNGKSTMPSNGQPVATAAADDGKSVKRAAAKADKQPEPELAPTESEQLPVKVPETLGAAPTFELED